MRTIFIYFYLSILIGLVWTFLWENEIQGYGPVFLIITSFPLGILFLVNFYEFGLLIKQNKLELFEKHKVKWLFLNGKILKPDSLFKYGWFTNPEFRNIEPIEIRSKYLRTVKLFQLSSLLYMVAFLMMFGLILVKKHL